MPTLDATFRDLAKNLIADKGKVVTVVRETRTFVPATGKNTTVVTNYSAKISPPAPFNQNRINDTTIIQGDMSCLLAAKGFAITPTARTDKMLFDGTTWQIVAVNPIYSGEQVAAWELQLRQ